MVLDTHAVVWHLLDSPRLSPKVLSLVEQAVRDGDPLYVSTISLLETVYLVEKRRLPEEALDRLIQTLSRPDSDIVSVSFSMAIALAARQIPREQVPDMPDRIVAATALHLGVPLITRDSTIQKAGIETIW